MKLTKIAQTSFLTTVTIDGKFCTVKVFGSVDIFGNNFGDFEVSAAVCINTNRNVFGRLSVAEQVKIEMTGFNSVMIAEGLFA